MARRKGKNISFDAMIKFFMQYYNIPTRRDFEKLMAKMDRLEALIRASGVAEGAGQVSQKKTAKSKAQARASGTTSSDEVLDVIKRFRKGVGFSEIRDRTGFGEKKLRNIIFRLHKMGKIVRINRGIYIAS